MPSTTGNKQAAVPVLESTEESAQPTSMIPNIKLFSPVPESFTTVAPIFCAKPVWKRAAPTTNMPANKTTVELERPLKTAFVGINPRSPQAIAPLIAVTAKGISSVTKNKATTANKIRHFTSALTIKPPFSK